jgi:hypothetical protein
VRATAALVAATALALTNIIMLLGTRYSRVAEDHIDTPQAAGTVAAARLAARLPPWSSKHIALHGWVLAESGNAEESRAAYRRALGWAPGDPLLWSEYALALGRLREFGAPLSLAVAQATRLAPTSAAVQRTIASLGLSYWSRGTPELRQLWLSSMRYELAHNRSDFLGHVLTRGQGRTFCRDPARALREDPWCEKIASALLGGCFRLDGPEPAPCE